MNAVAISREFRAALDSADVSKLSAIWGHVFPNLPQPSGRDQVEVVMHHARTAADSVGLAARLYSHAWLRERGHKSGLPREMRPANERRESIIVPAVGVSVGTLSRRADRREEAAAVEAVMAGGW